MKVLSALMMFLVLTLAAAPGGAAPAGIQFHRGVNLTGWFQAPEVGPIPASRFGPRDWDHLLALGVDVVRLPVNLTAYTGPGPEYRIDPRLFPLLDPAVDGLLARGLAVVLDNHGDPTAPRVKGDLERVLTSVWTQAAGHYRNRPAKLLWEIQNEPHDINPGDWDRIQHHVLAAIRTVAPDRTVVVTGADWGGEKGLEALGGYDDPHLVYTFHFYDPMIFTHQGAGWAGLAEVSGVPFPPRSDARPVIGPGSSAGWAPGALRTYMAGDPVPTLAKTLDRAAAFGRTRGAPVWCGEFGVYDAKADPADRVAWYRTVRGLLEERSIPWTMWDYKNSFGLFIKGSAENFDQDLNLPLVAALGFNTQPQSSAGPRGEQ